jgi:hypothetical protein
MAFSLRQAIPLCERLVCGSQQLQCLVIQQLAVTELFFCPIRCVPIRGYLSFCFRKSQSFHSPTKQSRSYYVNQKRNIFKRKFHKTYVNIRTA